MKALLAPLLLALVTVSACDDGHGATDDDVLDATADAAEDVAAPVDTIVPDVWPEGFWAPSSIEQLYGYWVNDDGTTVRVFRFAQFDMFDQDMAQISPVYELYKYDTGTKPVLLERGRATLSLGPVLHREVVWSETVTDKGAKREDAFQPAPVDTFALATGSGTPRVYVRAGKLP